MDAGGFTQGYNDTGGGLNGIGNGIIEGRFAAPYLGWEVEDKQNYGFDIGLFDNRLKLSLITSILPEARFCCNVRLFPSLAV